jgi:hypothetical protein
LSLAFQWRAKDFLALAMALRDGSYRGHLTAGGHFATFTAREILADFPELDSIVRQEAEETLVSLARAVACGDSRLSEIPGLALRDPATGTPYLTPQPALPDLATLPPPDRSGEPAQCFGHGIAPLVGSRGCYANCTFCCIAAWHEESQPGKRYRLRSVEDIADEMVVLQRTRGIDIFVFHDDNFFVPGHKKNAERFSALADALEARGIGPFATVVKARPTDVHPEVFRILKERLRCIRVYVGIETDADQGLVTLGRWSSSPKNHKAIELVRALDLYTCFNMLLFDPDTTVESLERNIDFMRAAADFPFNFGRVELYAGTPLLDRMLREGRCWGDYMQWDRRGGARVSDRPIDKKGLMPEILPAPTEPSTESPRERTRAHLKKILSAVAGVALSATTTAQADTTVPGTGDNAKGNDKKPPPSESKPKPPPRESLGYEVVDMLPEPYVEKRTGFLSITTTPTNAEVAIDGVPTGQRTPITRRKTPIGGIRSR